MDRPERFGQRDQRIASIVAGDDHDPFSYLGMHQDAGTGVVTVRVFHPGATSVEVLNHSTGEPVAKLARVHEAGLYAGSTGKEMFAYRLRVAGEGWSFDIEDPYRFGPVLGELDRQPVQRRAMQAVQHPFDDPPRDQRQPADAL